MQNLFWVTLRRLFYHDTKMLAMLDDRYINESEMPTSLAELSNADTKFITKAVNDLTNYYLKTETYTKTEVDNIIGNLGGFQVADSTESITNPNNHTIYFVKDDNATGDDKYKEYIWQEIEGVGTFVLVDDTSITIDLSDYATITAMNTALEGKQDTLNFDSTPTENSTNPVTSGGIFTSLANKQNALTFDTTPTNNSSNPVTSSGIYAALQGKQNNLSFDSTPTQGSSNPITSGGVYDALDDKLDADQAEESIYVTWAKYTALTEEEQEDERYTYYITDKNEIWRGDELYGTTDFSQMSNKPSINGVELDGNNTSSDLGIQTIQYTTLPLANADRVGMIVQYTGETTVTEPIYTNGYYYKCVANGTDPETYSWVESPTQDGGNANESVLSKSAYRALSNAEKMNGTTYYVEDETSTDSTVAVTPILNSGTKIAEIEIGGVTEDLYAPTPPTVDTSTFQPKTLATPISIDGTNATTVETALNALNNKSGSGGITDTLGFTPCGTVISYFGETAPQNYLVCDGSQYNKTDYPQLWTHLSSLTDTTPYVVDGDNTKFKVPDLRGEFLRGAGTNSHTNQGNGGDVGEHQDGTRVLNVELGKTDTLTTNNGLAQLNSDYDYAIPGSVEYRNNYSRTSFDSNVSPFTAFYTSRPTNTSVLYCIAYKDIYIDARYDYSTEEKVVGTWIDGKPIYQKTFDCGNLPNASSKVVQTGFDSTINVVRIFGSLKRSDGGSLPLPYVASGQYHQYNIDVQYQGTGGIYINTNENYSTTTATITIQYTKTTD